MELKGSGKGCHINNTFDGALCYASMLLYLALRSGLNTMISLFEVFAKSLILHLTIKKTVCVKFGQKLIECEHVYLNDKKIEWVNQIKHFGNDNNINLTIVWIAHTKKSICIGRVNRL